MLIKVKQGQAVHSTSSNFNPNSIGVNNSLTLVMMGGGGLYVLLKQCYYCANMGTLKKC